MKIKHLFDGYLSYCAVTGGRRNNGNCEKTITEKKRFLYGPIYEAVGEREVSTLKEIDIAKVKEAARKHGVFGEQRAYLYYRQLINFARRKMGIKFDFDFYDIKVPIVPEKDIEYLTEDELNQIRACFDLTEIAGLRTRALMEFMMGTALRIGEVCSLNRADINLETGEFKFKNIKTCCEERMVCPEHSLMWLKIYLSRRLDDHPALFISGRSRLLPMSSRNFIRHKTKHLGLNKRIAHHIFRKTCGTYMLLETDIKTVQTYLRHRDPKTTIKFYTAVTARQTRSSGSKITNKYVSQPCLQSELSTKKNVIVNPIVNCGEL